MLEIGFIGAGTVGNALARTLAGRGYKVVAVSSRSEASAVKLAEAVEGCCAYREKQDAADASELVFITTPDGAIPQVVSELRWRRGQSVVHCSGADSLDVLEKAKEDGAQVGAFHPLQTFAGVSNAIENLPGSTFALEAEGDLLDNLKGMAEALEGHWVRLGAGEKVLYHAAAVIACNYLVTLIKMATDLWQTFGVSAKETTDALLPLVRGTVNNIASIGLPGCLTGPIARGDLGTIKKHLNALEGSAPSLLPAYRELGLNTVPVAQAKGTIDGVRADELVDMLERK
ncbi:Rossmann-like and DUF2520 domain-containing protein [Chloroflexota bacterium]